MYAPNFLQERTNYTPTMILEIWSSSPDGQVRVHVSHDVSVYSLEHVYTSIKPARVALTAFAAQIVQKKLISVARKAVFPASSLHATSKKREVVWSDIGKATVAHVEGVFREYQPLTRNLLTVSGGDNFTRTKY